MHTYTYTHTLLSFQAAAEAKKQILYAYIHTFMHTYTYTHTLLSFQAAAEAKKQNGLQSTKSAGGDVASSKKASGKRSTFHTPQSSSSHFSKIDPPAAAQPKPSAAMHASIELLEKLQKASDTNEIVMNKMRDISLENPMLGGAFTPMSTPMKTLHTPPQRYATNNRRMMQAGMPPDTDSLFGRAVARNNESQNPNQGTLLQHTPVSARRHSTVAWDTKEKDPAGT